MFVTKVIVLVHFTYIDITPFAAFFDSLFIKFLLYYIEFDVIVLAKT